MPREKKQNKTHKKVEKNPNKQTKKKEKTKTTTKYEEKRSERPSSDGQLNNQQHIWSFRHTIKNNWDESKISQRTTLYK